MAARGAAPDAAFGFVEAQRGAMRLVAVDPRALSLGIAPGMTLADARARLPALAVFDTNRHADQLWIERIADLCDRYTPMVAIDAPDGLMLDISGCAHLFGGEDGLIVDIETRLARWTPHFRYALADTPEAAMALARYQATPAADEARAIRRLPVAALRLEPETELALRRAGLKTVGDLAARPSAPMAARFGEGVTAMLARLLGHTDSRIVPRRALPALVYERRFAEPIARTEDALGTIAELADEATGEMEQRACGGRRFAARLFRSDGAVCDLAVESGLPLRDRTQLMRLFGERLDALADPIDPGFGFEMIRLAVVVTEPMAATQLQLEGGGIAEDVLTALIDRLSTRLGRGRIRRFVPQDTHIPEQGVLALPAIDLATPSAWPEPVVGEPPLRPLHMFDPPQPVEVVAEVPDGPPQRFRWRRTLHEVRRYEGPERISAEWWKRKDGQGLTRDYYRVEDARGRRFWIFRHGLYGSEKADPGWYMHGLFA